MNLTSAGAWQSGAADVYSNATNAWVTQATRTFTVESYTLCLYDTVTLRITIGCATASGTVFADAVYCWPDSDIMAVLGHNMSTVLVPTWRHSDDNASFTTVSTMTIARPSFFVAPTTSTKRYQSLKLTGTPRVAPYIGELIQSQRKTLSNDILPSMQIASTVLQTRSADRAHQYGSDLVRTIACKMKHFGVANYKEYRDEVFERSSGGASPILLVPISTETDVFYGRIRETWSAVRQGPQFWSESSFTLTELATPMNMGT
jgi:hypothetical protein